MSARDEAKSKLAEGKQSLKAKQYEEAVELLARALEIMTEVCADAPLSQEIAPFYVEYGYALLTHAQQSNDVFGSAVKAAQKAKEEKESGAAPVAAEAAESGDEPEEESTDEPAATEDDATGGVDDDLELAWQMLEHARLIFEQDKTANAEALAEVHEMLGNISMENEDFTTSADEFAQCLQFWLDASAATVAAGGYPKERQIAAAHSNLALSHLYSDQPASALVQYVSLAECFKQRSLRLLSNPDQLPSTSSSSSSGSADQDGDALPYDGFIAIPEGTKAVSLDASLVTPAALAAFRDQHSGIFNISAVAAEIQECVEVLNDTNERITDLEQQIRSADEESKAIKSIKGSSTTTIGFGSASSIAASFDLSGTAASTSAAPFAAFASASTNSGFSFTPLSNSAATATAQAAPVTMLAAKRKVPVVTSATADDSTKKPKTEQ